MSLIRPTDRREFSFVPGFGDDVRRAVDHGFSEHVAAHLRQRHPAVEVVFYLPDPSAFRVFVRGDNGTVFLLRSVGRSSTEQWALVDDLDRAHHAGRHESNRQMRRRMAAGELAHEERAQRELVESVVDADAGVWIYRKHLERIQNRGDPFPQVAVPRNYGVGP